MLTFINVTPDEMERGHVQTWTDDNGNKLVTLRHYAQNESGTLRLYAIVTVTEDDYKGILAGTHALDLQAKVVKK